METDAILHNCRAQIDEFQLIRKLETRSIKEETEQLLSAQEDQEELKVIQEVLQTASKLMYTNLSVKLGNVITEGLTLVFPESNLRFVVDFVERRNQIEADLYLVDEEGNQYDPVNSVGGGITDFISLLLRVAYIALSKYRNFIAADEPSKFISRDKIYDATVFLAKVCDDLKFDLLVVTHIPEMVDAAKTVYFVRKRQDISQVRKHND